MGHASPLSADMRHKDTTAVVAVRDDHGYRASLLLVVYNAQVTWTSIPMAVRPGQYAHAYRQQSSPRVLEIAGCINLSATIISTMMKARMTTYRTSVVHSPLLLKR